MTTDIPEQWRLWSRDVWPAVDRWEPIGAGSFESVERLMTNLRSLECERELVALPAGETPDRRRAQSETE